MFRPKYWAEDSNNRNTAVRAATEPIVTNWLVVTLDPSGLIFRINKKGFQSQTHDLLYVFDGCKRFNSEYSS